MRVARWRLLSQEADVASVNAMEQDEIATLIDGTIGELSLFHETFGYYAHGVTEETVILPDDWKNRVVIVSNENTRGASGLCLHPEDLAVSKLIAGREKDISFRQARHSGQRQLSPKRVPTRR